MVAVHRLVERAVDAVASGVGHATQARTADDEMFLMQRVSEGDRQAFDRVFSEFSGLVYGIALRRTHDIDTAEDVVADVMLRIYRSAKSFHAGSRLSTWITKIAINATIDAARKKARERTISFDEAFDGSDEWDEWSTQTEVVSPDDWIDEEQVAVLKIAFDELQQPQKTLLLMYHRDQLPCAQIANELHVPVGTVKSKLHRARNTLRVYFQAAWRLQHAERQDTVPLYLS
jgi:RNA polymerase sigma-70 factor (ECF subfamily)